MDEICADSSHVPTLIFTERTCLPSQAATQLFNLDLSLITEERFNNFPTFTMLTYSVVVLVRERMFPQPSHTPSSQTILRTTNKQRFILRSYAHICIRNVFHRIRSHRQATLRHHGPSLGHRGETLPDIFHLSFPMVSAFERTSSDSLVSCTVIAGLTL